MDDSNLIFQIVSWSCIDYDFDADDDDASQNSTENAIVMDKSRYLVKVFGVTKTGESVSVNILNYTPFFFIKLPISKVSDYVRNQFHKYIVSQMPPPLKESVLGTKVVQKKDFYGFHNGQQFNFLRFTFSSLKAFRAGIRIFQKSVIIPGWNMQKFKLYESNIDPFLRLIHIRDIEPTGWVSIPKNKLEINSEVLQTRCKIDVNCHWTSISRYTHEAIAPLVVLSFDLECSSSHGDFPVASKDYRKLAQNILTKYGKCEENCEVIKSEILLYDMLSVFDPFETESEFHKVFPRYNIDITNIKKQLIKSIDDILAIIKGRLVFNEGVRQSPTPTDKVTKDDILRSLIFKLDSIGLPPLEGDKIIQIGTTVHTYGEKSCNFRSIITLGSCDPIEGIHVESCETEQEMLIKWRDLVNLINPDIVTGYNIFGFDFPYIYTRAKELGICDEFCKLGKIADKTCSFVEKTLSSSALGDNFLRYIEMDGRVLIDLMKVVQRDHKLDSYRLDAVANYFMKMNKHDLHPNDIFRLFKGSSSDRKVIAEYCVQDCELCNLLIIKLETLANNIGMSNVCYVPLSYIFLRGQSIKIFSLVAKQCREDDFIIPSLSKPFGEKIDDADDDGYEGAIVLQPKTGIYIDDPVSVLDYASLYPSSMISENLSHDMLVMSEKYNNLPGVEYLDIPYDLYEGVGDKKQKIGEKVCRFVQTKEKGVLPRILMKLLRQRKETRKKIEFETICYVTPEGDRQEVTGSVCETADGKISIGGQIIVGDIVSRETTYNEFQKAVLDGLQSAYKVTANSLYGQTGSKISSIYMKEIAACTTATGRKMILLAKKYLEENFNADIIYGDTDSLFVCFDVRDENGNKLKGKDALAGSRRMGIEASQGIKKIIKPPHDLEWEKLFWPMILFSKKRYVANKYEYDDNKYKQSSMGIVMKRRDNANIVKKIYGGILDIILNEKDIPKSIEFLKRSIADFIEGKYPVQDLTITKSLKGHYLEPDKIAHKVLADRVKEREPGNAFQVNDRIPYIYIKVDEPKRGKPAILQGDRIETVDYFIKNSLKPDYEFYLTNQIMKSILQLYALVLESLAGYRKGRNYYPELYAKLLKEKDGNEKKARERWQDLREAEVKSILFDPFLIKLDNAKKGFREITDFFKPI